MRCPEFCLELSGGKAETIIDADDVPLVLPFRWYVTSGEIPYARARVNGSEYVYLHKFLLGVGRGVMVDHANRNSLDNRRCNLRVATASQNNANAIYQLSRSGFRGVRQGSRTRSFRARIKVNRQQIELGHFPTAVAAAEAYDDAAYRYFGRFAVLNFPERLLGAQAVQKVGNPTPGVADVVHGPDFSGPALITTDNDPSQVFP